MSPGQRIRELRVKHSISQKELSKDLGYKTYTTVSKWESDASLPPGKELTKLATYFDVSTDYLLGLDDDIHNGNIEDLSDTIELDYIGSYTPDVLQTRSIQDKIPVPRYIIEENPDHYFVARVQTDSMNRLIPSGSNAVILNFSKTSNTDVQTGDILVVRLDGEIKIHHLRKTDTIAHLEPYSYLEGYQAISLENGAFEKIDIIGKVIYTFQRF